MARDTADLDERLDDLEPRLARIQERLEQLQRRSGAQVRDLCQLGDADRRLVDIADTQERQEKAAGDA